jgi:hypothetical protein
MAHEELKSSLAGCGGAPAFHPLPSPPLYVLIKNRKEFLK